MRDATRMTPETIVGFVALSVAASLFASVSHGQALQDLAVEQQGLNERPAPGTLVIYVIPMTLRELWNM